ncbi:MAG: DUF5652 family protein [Patescibacteria group bacterium]
MWENYLSHWALPLSILGIVVGGILLIVFIIWSVYWKGRALWRAAHLNSKPWFVALLVINTLGILEILYIYVFSKKKKP